MEELTTEQQLRLRSFELALNIGSELDYAGKPILDSALHNAKAIYTFIMDGKMAEKIQTQQGD